MWECLESGAEEGPPSDLERLSRAEGKPVSSTWPIAKRGASGEGALHRASFAGGSAAWP